MAGIRSRPGRHAAVRGATGVLALLIALALVPGSVAPAAGEAGCRSDGTACSASVPATAASTDEATAGGVPARHEAAPAEEAAPVEKAVSAEEAAVDVLCRLLLTAAERHAVPADFFIRLIWTESRFDPHAVSPVGAQGIAQFMPQTARLRGLADPFDTKQALLASAAFLAELEARFGSWGLAAIGYNGGPNRVPPFLAGHGALPSETVRYVFAVTGRTAGFWAERARRAAAGGGTTTAASAGPAAPAKRAGAAPEASDPVDAAAGASALPRPRLRPDYTPRRVDCPRLVARLGKSRSVAPPGGLRDSWTVWGAQVAGHPQRAVAMRQYERLTPRLPSDLVAAGPQVIVRRFAARGRLPIHAVQFPAAGRTEAERLCRRIAAARAPCVVVKNG